MVLEIETVGQRIKSLRKKSGMTQAEFGELIKLGHSQVSNIEKNKYEPSNDTLKIVSEHFEVSMDWLIKGEETPYKSNASIVSYQNSEPGYALFVDLPYIPVIARATFVESFNQTQGGYENMETYRVYNVDELLLRKKPAVIEIDGDSMEPQLKSGMKILGIPKDKGDWPYIKGKVCAVAFKDYFVVKRVKENHIISNGTILLQSDNESGGSMVVNVGDILGIWQGVQILPSPIE